MQEQAEHQVGRIGEPALSGVEGVDGGQVELGDERFELAYGVVVGESFLGDGLPVGVLLQWLCVSVGGLFSGSAFVFHRGFVWLGVWLFLLFRAVLLGIP